MPDMLKRYRQLKHASRIEEVLCLATLVAVGKLQSSATTLDALHFYESLGTEDCSTCPFFSRCLACAINE